MDSRDVQQLSIANIDASQDTLEPFSSTRIQSQTPTYQQRPPAEFDHLRSGMVPPSCEQMYALMSSQYQQRGQNIPFQGLPSVPNWTNLPAVPAAPNPPRKQKKTSFKPENAPELSVRHWTVEEDIALTKARLHVSCDPIVGVGQKSGTLWSRILQVWRQNMGVYDAARDSNALSCRWGRIQSEVNRYHAYYERLVRTPQSGSTPECIRRGALRLYQDDPASKNQPFKHEECWELCRKNAKWCTEHLTKQNGVKKRKCQVDISNDASPLSKQAMSDPTSITEQQAKKEREKKEMELREKYIMQS
ncbi:hypothetical protein OROHE_018918 [Orobanche hederae]